MAQPQIPGDVVINTVSFFVTQGVINATEHVKYLDIYEGILTPGIIVTAVIDDTKNLLSNLPILGGEKMTVEYTAPGRTLRHLDLVVSKVSEASVSNNARAKTFKITAVTNETMTDKTVQISKAYNTNISTMVQDILTTFLKSSKTQDIQTTRGVQKILIPSIRPFEAIKMLRKRSISSEDNSSMYVFYENIDGFHFKTIEKIFTDGTVGDRQFINDETRRTDVSLPNFRNIISHKEPNQFNLPNRLKTGGLAHQVKQFDMKTLTYKSAVSKFNASNYKSADGTLVSPDNTNTPNLYGGTGSDSWVLNDTGNPDTFISDGLGPRMNIATLMGQGFLHLHVFGDSELSAGQLITVNLNEPTSATTAPNLHPQLSGNYIIAFIRHIILPEGTSPRYTCAIEALKGSYKEAVAS